ncbi:MAG: feruloyl-CoA synthase [Bryobacterales bacterium]|nr:feruloyl-CoA synthase [Bryobacterales bacterium]
MSAPTAPVREIRLAPTRVIVERKPGGAIYVRSALELGPYPGRMTDRLDYWAEHAPHRTFIAQRTKDDAWRRLTYSQAAEQARRIAQALVDRPLSSKRPIAILSGNDIEHALLGLGAMYAGVPYSPISTAYSLVSTDFGKLKHIFNVLTPGLVFAASGEQYSRAIRAVIPQDAELVCVRDPLPGATIFSDLIAASPGPALEEAYARVGPDTVFKILFTSGSTGMPKGVIYTHRVWTSNQQQVRQCWPFVEDEPPVILEWLPWNHTFAGSKDFGLILYNGGTLYLDEGRPVPGAFDETLRNLREIAPTIVLNVPKGFEALIPHLRKDPELRQHYFSRLKALFYAGAGISQEVWDALQDLSIEACGERILMLSGLGATETGPFALWVGKDVRRAGECGVPAPGMELKLIPSGHKLEARLRGPNITPGYWNQPELTRAAFDEEGFYKIGDALRFVDESDPDKGFIFDGRIAEDFKLSTATWVSVGPMRVNFLAHFAPYAKEVVIAGADRDFVGALIFPDIAACRELSSEPCSVAELLARPQVRAKFRELLAGMAKTSTGSSNRIARAIILDVPPSIDAHELTDKGSISQRAVLENRAEVVEELYSGSERVISIT